MRDMIYTTIQYLYKCEFEEYLDICRCSRTIYKRKLLTRKEKLGILDKPL